MFNLVAEQSANNWSRFNVDSKSNANRMESLLASSQQLKNHACSSAVQYKMQPQR